MSEVPVDTSRAKWIFLSTLLRGVVAAIFVYAAVGKVGDLDNFATSIRAYQTFPTNATNVMAFTVPWIELVAAGLLVFGVGHWRQGARLLFVIMLVLFTALKLSALQRGLILDCGCVSEDSLLAPLFDDVWGIVTNVVLLGCLGLDFLCARRAAPKPAGDPAAGP